MGSLVGNVSHSASQTFGFRGTVISLLTRDFFWPTVFLTTWYPLDFLTQVFGCYLHGRIPFLRPAPAYRVVVLDFLKLYLIIVHLRPLFSWTRWFYLVLGLGPSSLGNSLPFTEVGGGRGGLLSATLFFKGKIGFPQIFSPFPILEWSILLKRLSTPEEGRVFLLPVWIYPDSPVSHGLCLAGFYLPYYKQCFTVPHSYVVCACI